MYKKNILRGLGEIHGAIKNKGDEGRHQLMEHAYSIFIGDLIYIHRLKI